MCIKTEISGIEIGDHSSVKVVGVVNLSRQSFYKQSVTTKPDDVSRKVEKFIEEGAHFIDIGARSTAPGTKPISVEEELNRLIPSLKNLLNNFDIPISVDTQYASIAEKSLKMGATIINDVSGFRTDPNIMKTIVDHDASTIIMASKEKPGDCMGINNIISELDKSIGDIENLGLSPNNIIIDPGIGKWIPEKIYTYNLEIIDELSEFRVLNKPILVAISRKSFIGDILGYPDPKDRLMGSLACTSIAVYNGAHMVRTHDVKETLDIIKMSHAFRKYRY
jgi:dihydropteroate synthase